METDLQLLAERVKRLLEISRQLSDENQLLRGRLGEAAMTQADMQQRLAEARARVESALSYTKSFNESEDALAKLLRDVGSGVSGVGKWVAGKFRGN